MKISKKILMLFMIALLAIAAAACDGSQDNADNPNEPAANDTGVVTDDNMDDMAETPSDEAPGEVIEQEPDPGISQQEMNAIPVTAARSSELLGHSVDLNNIAVIDTEEMEEAADKQAAGDTEEAAEVMNDEAQEASGEISDLLINTNGAIEFVLLDINEGFVDLNDTTVAIPWDMIQVAGIEEDGIFSDYHVTFTGTADNLNSAPVVEENMFDGDFWIDPAEYDLMENASGDSLYLATAVSDLNLVNPAGEDLGEVEDLLIDTQEGMVSYAVTDFGGFLGMAETSTAVPWKALSFDTEAESYVLDVTPEQLENAPEIDVSTFDNNVFDENWDAEFAQFWNNLTDFGTN